MYAIPRFSVTNPVLVNLITVILLVTGLVIVFLLPRELFPMVSTDFVFVTTIYPRASADEMEKTITVLLEEELSDVRGVKTMRSTTVEGRSIILLEVDTKVSSTLKVQRDAENEVDKVIPDLPIEAEKPVVTEFVFDFPVITVSLSGAVNEHELKRVADNVKDRLKAVRGVSDVTIGGERDEEIWVEIDPRRLYGYGLTLEEVRRAVQVGGLDLAAGLARTAGEEFIIRTKELYSNPQDIKRVVLKAENKGGRVCVADIADVRDTFEEASNIGRLDGERCINLEVKQRPGGDSVQIVREVREALASIEKDLPYGVMARQSMDLSFMVRERLDLLASNGIQGLFLCLLLLRLFLNGRMALLTAAGIPFAMMGAFVMMYFTGISLNMISMFGLMIVLGMLVDDGIVVAENVHRYRSMGFDPVTAAIKGTGEVFWSVIGSVTTTIASFMPIFFMTGIMGKFCQSIPLVVTFALVASVIEAMICLPTHLAVFGDPVNWDKVDHWGAPIRKAVADSGIRSPMARYPVVVRPLVLLGRMLAFGIWSLVYTVMHAFTRLMRIAQWCGNHFDACWISPNQWFPSFLSRYVSFMVLCLRHRLAFMVVSLSLLVSFSVYASMRMKFELFKNDDFVFFMINLEMPESTRLEQTEKAIELVEEHLLGLPKNYIEAVVTRVGFIEDASTGQMKYGSGKAQIVVDLTESAVRPGISGKDIMDLSRKNFPEIPGMMSIEFQEDRGGPPVGSALTFRIMAEDYPTILKISEEVQSYLRTVPGLKDIKDDFEWGKEEFRIDVDERRAADLGISVAEVAREVRNAFAGGLATTFTRGEEEVEIHVKFTEGYRSSPENIRIMKFRNDKGEMVPFDSFARVDYGRSFSSIQRWNQKRTVTVTADVDGVHITSRGINQMMQDRYGNVSKDHAGVLFDYGGEEEDSQESMAALGRAFALAMLINYGIIATIFNSVMQPFVVMSVIPLSLVGVLIGLLVHNEPLGFMGLLGVVALVGIVVNNSILLVDFTNQARKRGMNRWRSILWASRSRVRPIILTSATTVAGLFPMLFGLSGTSSFLVPLAISLVYGLTFSTILTLVVIPVLMSLLDEIKLYSGVRLLREEYDESLLNQDFKSHPVRTGAVD